MNISDVKLDNDNFVSFRDHYCIISYGLKESILPYKEIVSITYDKSFNRLEINTNNQKCDFTIGSGSVDVLYAKFKSIMVDVY